MKSKKSSFLLVLTLIFCGIPQEVKPISPVAEVVLEIMMVLAIPQFLTVCAGGAVLYKGIKTVKYYSSRRIDRCNAAKYFVISAEEIRDYSVDVQIFSAHKAGKRSEVICESSFSYTSLDELMEEVKSYIDDHDGNNRVSIYPAITLVSGESLFLADFEDKVKDSDQSIDLLFEILHVRHKKDPKKDEENSSLQNKFIQGV